MGEPHRSNDETPSPAIPTVVSSRESIPLSLLFIMEPSVCDESGQIVGTFSNENGKILLVDPSQTKPYFEVKILNPYSWKKMLSNGI